MAVYFKLVRMKMPSEQIKSKMKVEGYEPSLLDTPDAPMPADPSPGAAGAAEAAAPAAPAGAAAATAAAGGEEETAAAAAEPEPDVLKVKDDPQYKVYFKMLNMGVPTGNIKLKMQMEGADPAALDLDPNAPSPNAGAVAVAE